MKRLIYLSGLFVLFTACNSVKLNPSTIVIGETDDMLVIEHDKTFNGVFVGTNEVNTRSVNFDINGDGQNNFQINSRVDTLENSAENASSFKYSVSIVPNNSTVISEVHNYLKLWSLPLLRCQ